MIEKRDLEKKKAKSFIERVQARRIYWFSGLLLGQLLFFLLIFYTVQTNVFNVISIASFVSLIAFAWFIMTQHITTAAKLSWLLSAAIAPLFTCLFYLFINGSLMQKRTLLANTFKTEQIFVKYFTMRGKSMMAEWKKILKREDLENFYNLATLIFRHCGSRIYANQQVKYYRLGDDVWPDIKSALLAAQKHICIEFYIIKNGKMLDELLDILSQKLQSGVKVYFLYDGACELLLDFDLAQTLRNAGAKTAVFMPINGQFTMDHNHRDHRKLILIDGEIAFTGGLNIADEYINQKSPFGHWKDAAICVKGDAVMRMQAFFLANFSASYTNENDLDISSLLNPEAAAFNLSQREVDSKINVHDYDVTLRKKREYSKRKEIEPSRKFQRTWKLAKKRVQYAELSTKNLDRQNDLPWSHYNSSHTNNSNNKYLVTSQSIPDGFTASDLENLLVPYADAPSVNNSISENVYLQAIYTASKSISIMTPYLILSDEMIRALTVAATRGLDLEIYLPSIADKRVMQILARTIYPQLLHAGIKIYEYLPGFIHSKVMQVDDRLSIVGTINFDYRSLYLNFENAVLVYDPELAKDIAEDFRQTRAKCRAIDLEFCQKLPLRDKIFGIILRPLSPLL